MIRLYLPDSLKGPEQPNPVKGAIILPQVSYRIFFY